MTKYCIICGAELTQTNRGTYICPNCGVKVINQEEDNNDEEEMGYVG